MPIAESDRIVLTRPLPEVGLSAGDVGVVVHAYAAGQGFEIEVFSLTGDTVAVVTAPADAVRPVSRNDVVSARMLAA